MKNLPPVITNLTFNQELQFEIMRREIDAATSKDLETLKAALISEIKQKMVLQSNVSQLVKNIISHHGT